MVDVPAELNALLGANNEVWGTHSVYEWDAFGRKILIPTLVLMRAFFHPSQKLLPEMFRPQALDRICCLEIADGGSSLHVILPGTMPGNRHARNLTTQLLTWMRTYPTAYQMAGSFHRYGLEGRIDISLPAAVANIEAAGFEYNDSFFVTHCSILRLTPEEQPMYLEIAKKDIVSRAWRGDLVRVARHSDGIKITDEEWLGIEPLLEPREKGFPKKLSHRLLLDNILEKLARACAWRHVSNPAGSELVAPDMYKALIGEKLDNVLEYLEHSRLNSW